MDQSKLQNDLDAAKPAVRQKEIDKQEAIEAKAECEKVKSLIILEMISSDNMGFGWAPMFGTVRYSAILQLNMSEINLSL